MFIYPYKAGSASAKALSQMTGAMRIRKEGSRFKGSPDKMVINWGNSGELSDEINKCIVLNKPEVVANASNKLKFFRLLEEHNGNARRQRDIISYPSFTIDKEQATEWLVYHGMPVVVRTILNGHSGEGIVMLEPSDNGVEVPDAPLYVQYVPKKQEYRVHVAGGVVVDLQRKARRQDVPDGEVNWRIRNHDNGFIFARNDLDVPDQVSQQALLACEACGLDFGAVDIIYNERREKAYVLEVNTAPGLTGQTLQGYADRFMNWDAVPQVVVPRPDDLREVLGAVDIPPAPRWIIRDEVQDEE